jgi:hypothetical protein
MNLMKIHSDYYHNAPVIWACRMANIKEDSSAEMSVNGQKAESLQTDRKETLVAVVVADEHMFAITRMFYFVVTKRMSSYGVFYSIEDLEAWL